jgi:hypothetical protein
MEHLCLGELLSFSTFKARKQKKSAISRRIFSIKTNAAQRYAPTCHLIHDQWHLEVGLVKSDATDAMQRSPVLTYGQCNGPVWRRERESLQDN